MSRLLAPTIGVVGTLAFDPSGWITAATNTFDQTPRRCISSFPASRRYAGPRCPLAWGAPMRSPPSVATDEWLLDRLVGRCAGRLCAGGRRRCCLPDVLQLSTGGVVRRPKALASSAWCYAWSAPTCLLVAFLAASVGAEDRLVWEGARRADM